MMRQAVLVFCVMCCAAEPELPFHVEHGKAMARSASREVARSNVSMSVAIDNCDVCKEIVPVLIPSVKKLGCTAIDWVVGALCKTIGSGPADVCVKTVKAACPIIADHDLPADKICEAIGQCYSPYPPSPSPSPYPPSPSPYPPSPSPSPSPYPPSPGSGCADTSGWANQYEGTNPLGIQPNPNRQDNYFVIIGDWGHPGGPGSCQRRVADLLKQYVRKQNALGKKCLFVGSVGDNFYWSGQDGNKWAKQWGDVYGTADPHSPLYNIPWLAVLGNHDCGVSDRYVACPSRGRYATVGGNVYGSLQFNKDKNPRKPDWASKFWMPDYNFHYEIPEVGVEVIGVDTNGDHIDDLNGHGHAGPVWNTCGGRGAVAGFLGKIKRSGDEVLRCRARKGRASTVLIMQHYPSNGWAVKRTFEGALYGRNVGVISAFGHTHEQVCKGSDHHGQCNVVMTGSGGGCCGSDLPHNHAGFTAVHLTNDGGFRSDVDSADVRLPRGACSWNYASFSTWLMNATKTDAFV